MLITKYIDEAAAGTADMTPISVDQCTTNIGRSMHHQQRFLSLIQPPSAGSGIPQMKALLSGAPLERTILRKRTFVAKTLGLLFAIGCGMYVGKEGPWVHTSMC
jgi:hypothetical protein